MSKEAYRVSVASAFALKGHIVNVLDDGRVLIDGIDRTAGIDRWYEESLGPDSEAN